MKRIEATVKGGKVVPNSPVDWQEGMRVLMEPEPPGLAYERKHGHEPPEGWEVPDWDWTAAFGTYFGGHACPDEPVSWPDGWRVDIEARPNDRPPLGLKAIHGMLQNGRIVLDEPPDWPDGIRVVIQLIVTGNRGIAAAEPDEEVGRGVTPTLIVEGRKDC